MTNVFHIITIVSAGLMVAFIMAQARGSSLGEAWGGDSTFYHKRRGPELLMFQLTVFFAVIFVLSIVLGIITK